MKCEVIQDLIPSYIDEICSIESRKLVEEHIATCEKCKQYLQSAKTGVEIGKEEKFINLEAMYPLKKVKKNHNIALIVLATILIGFFGIYLIMSQPTKLDDLDKQSIFNPQSVIEHIHGAIESENKFLSDKGGFDEQYDDLQIYNFSISYRPNSTKQTSSSLQILALDGDEYNSLGINITYENEVITNKQVVNSLNFTRIDPIPLIKLTDALTTLSKINYFSIPKIVIDNNYFYPALDLTYSGNIRTVDYEDVENLSEIKTVNNTEKFIVSGEKVYDVASMSEEEVAKFADVEFYEFQVQDSGKFVFFLIEK